jgi:excisionase family DNA binding protein
MLGCIEKFDPKDFAAVIGRNVMKPQQPPQVAPQHPQPFTVAEPKVLAYTIDEATKISKVGRSKLYVAIQQGSLRARKLGKKI